MAEERKEIKTIDELVTSDFAYPKLSELEGKTITIEYVDFGNGRYGEYALVRTADGKVYRTSNKVILKQLKQIKDYLGRYAVTAKVSKVKNYYILTRP